MMQSIMEIKLPYELTLYIIIENTKFKYRILQCHIIVMILNNIKLKLKCILGIMMILLKVFALYIWFNVIQSAIINFQESGIELQSRLIF